MAEFGRASPTPRGLRRSVLYQVAIAVVVGTFTAYFCLVAYCDLFPPEALGAELVATSGGTIVRAVAPGSAVDRAGLIQDDIILTVEGHHAWR